MLGPVAGADPADRLVDVVGDLQDLQVLGADGLLGDHGVADEVAHVQRHVLRVEGLRIEGDGAETELLEMYTAEELVASAGLVSAVNAEGWSVVHALNMHHWVEENPMSALLALVLFCGVCFYLYKGARSAASD